MLLVFSKLAGEILDWLNELVIVVMEIRKYHLAAKVHAEIRLHLGRVDTVFSR